MFNFHKCNVKEGKERIVYQNEEIVKLYEKVYFASLNMQKNDIFSQKQSTIIKHSNDFISKVETNWFHLFLMPVVIHNKTYQFVIDTGAQISGIMDKHKDLIERYKTKHNIGIKSVSGAKKELPMICLDRFFAGSLEILNHHMVTLNSDDFKLPFMNKNITEFDGILGWDILSKIDFELDDKNHRFSMIESDDKFTYCNLIAGMFPIVIVEDDDHKPAIFGIDSGAEMSWLSDEYCKKRNLKLLKESKTVHIGVHGFEKTKIQLVKECNVSFYKSEIHLENVRNGETKVFDSLVLDGILGNEIFRNKRIQFLNSKGIVRIL